MRFVKFILQKGQEITVPEDKAEAILNSSEQIFKITDNKGQWTGETINKAYLITTQRDYDKEREWKRDNTPKLADPEDREVSEEEKAKIERSKEKIRQRFGGKKRIDT